MRLHVLKLVAKAESDLVVGRLRASQIAELAGLSELERTRLVTAVSEIVRNAIVHAGEARVEFAVDESGRKQFIEVVVSDSGPGFSVATALAASEKTNGGIACSRKIVDELNIASHTELSGTTVTLRKSAGKRRKWITPDEIEQWVETLKNRSPFSVVEDLEQQNKQLIDTLAEVHRFRVKLEERTEQLNQANKYKGEFLANMSHEIRTPMNAVIGMSNILARTGMTAEQKKYLSLINSAGNSLLDIINDILDFSKIEAGKLSIENVSFDLFDVVETCIEILSSNAQAKNLALLSWIDPGLPSKLQGDPVRLRQILVNLINNAIKFTEKGEVIAKISQVARTGDDIRLRFEVIDSGIGLTEEQQQKLFQPFVQADGSTTRKYGGTGLGLSICKQLTSLMGGEIGVESIVGAGSTFWFEFPFVVDSSEFASTKTIPFKRALVVDDHPAMREIISCWFNSWQIEHESAASALDALEKASKQSFDLFLVDYFMPGMNGLELVNRLRTNNNTRDTKIVLLTALQDEGLGEAAIKGGCDAFLTKPIRMARLADCLSSLADESYVRDSEMPVVAKVGAITPGPSTEQRGHVKAVLLVEDNPTNQIVAGIELTAIGLTVTIANNGEEALKLLESNDFAIIFMDCQMPVLDGYETTRAIRKLERKTGKHVPIVAMTANAMEGDREKCLAAGMDDYITKPFDPEGLKSMVARWSSAGGTGDGGIQNAEIESPIDFEKFKARFNEAQARQLLTVFLQDTEEKLGEIDVLASKQDFDGVEKLAHAIKGAAAMIFAEPLAQAAKNIELTLKAGTSENLSGMISSLRTKYELLKVSSSEIL